MRILILLFIIFQLKNCSFAMYYNINTDFFTKFNDDCLTSYIYKALTNNHDLKKTDYIVEQYRYEITNAFSKELPQLSVGGNYLGTHFPSGDMNFFVKENSFIMPTRVNFEPDLLLKNKDRIEATKKLYNAQVSNQKRTYISLICDVATTYLNILLYDFLIEKQTKIVINKKENLSKNVLKFEEGIIDLIQLNDYENQYIRQEIALENLIKNQKTTLYNFCNLIGESALNWEEIKRGKIEDFEYLETIPTIINSDLIYNRPDLIEMENKLKSAKIDVKIAKKEFFPSFNLSSGIVFDTAGRGNFFDWGSSFAYLVLGVTQDIFQGGKKFANLKIKQARFKQLLEEFKQLDLVALKEVINALNLIEQDTKAQNATKKQLDFEKTNFLKQGNKYKEGIISKFDYLENQSNIFFKEQLFMASKAVRLSDYFTLYKALGGAL